MQASQYRGDDVALFIDWENFKISLAAGHRLPNMSALKEEVANYGRVVVAKAYADWVTKAPELRGASQFLNDPPSLYAAGIEPVFVPTRPPSSGAAFANGVRTSRIKNSVDVKMTADCIECAHSYPNIGTFVLVSGDSDFIHVVNALRTMGKQVVVVGVSWSTSRRLADQVDTLVLYDVDVDPVVIPSEPAAVAVASVAAPDAAPGRQDLPDIMRAIEDIIRDERRAGGNPLLTSIKQRLVRRYANFDEKKVGFPGFKKLMARVAQEGNIKLITAGLVDWAIMADEETPEGAIEESPSGVAARPSRRRGGRYSRHRPEAEMVPGVPAEDADPTGELSSEPSNGDQPEYDEAGRLHAEPAVNGHAASEEFAAANGSEPTTPVSPFGGDAELAEAMRDAVAGLDLPANPEDGLHPERVADIIVMADYLEHQEGVSHVAFNFLVEQICENLNRGLSEEAAEITAHWGDSSSRTYVSKMLRSLSDGQFFQKGSHTWRDEASGLSKRRRTFNLNREFPLVQQVLEARWGGGQGPETDEGGSSTPIVPEDGDFELEGVPQAEEGLGFTVSTEMETETVESGYTVSAPVEEPAGTTPETSFISRLFRPLRN